MGVPTPIVLIIYTLSFVSCVPTRIFGWFNLGRCRGSGVPESFSGKGSVWE